MAKYNGKDILLAVQFVDKNEGGSGGDTVVNGIIEQYKVNAGATVNAGDFVEFVTRYGNGTFFGSAVSEISACKLDNSRVLVVYRDTYGHGRVSVLTVNETTVTVGTPILLNNTVSGFYYNTAVALTDSKVLLTYSSTNDAGYAKVLIIDGTTIIEGTDKFLGTTTSKLSAVALTDSKVLIAGNFTKGTTRILTVIETDISLGSTATFYDNTVGKVRATALTDSKVLLSFLAGGALRIVIVTISGVQATVAQVVSINGSCPHFLPPVALNAEKVFIAYMYNTIATVAVLTIDETTVYKASKTIYGSFSGDCPAVALTDSKVLIAYGDSNNSNYGTVKILTIDGTTVTEETEKTIDYNASSYISLVALSESSALAIYNNGVGAYSGITIDGTDISVDDSTPGTYVQPATSRMHNVGVAKTGGTAGETVDVYCVG